MKMNCESWLHNHHYDVWLQWASYHEENHPTFYLEEEE
jgi:hypothetical protein